MLGDNNSEVQVLVKPEDDIWLLFIEVVTAAENPGEPSAPVILAVAVERDGTAITGPVRISEVSVGEPILAVKREETLDSTHATER